MEEEAWGKKATKNHDGLPRSRSVMGDRCSRGKGLASTNEAHQSKALTAGLKQCNMWKQIKAPVDIRQTMVFNRHIQLNIFFNFLVLWI